jgi:2-polyprenyl-6-methoxyphenol hydroxylase-like FAD-dependent oxidoreductase
VSVMRFLNAVVAGGSIAGLFAARVLAQHFERVVVIDKDTLARGSMPRKGVPQGRHVHVLLARGLVALERLFPNLTKELIDSGAIVIEGGRELAWNHLGKWRVSDDRDLVMLSMSRLLLESVVAHRIRLMPNVELLERTRVVGFRSDNSQRVTGVRVASAEQAFDTTGRAAALVVDATGRGSASPRWLEELGFKAPKADHIPARITYATCTFSRSESWPPWRGLVIGGAPSRRGAVVLPIERDLWLVSLAGYFDEQMPSNHLEFLEFARSLATPELYEALRPQEPMSDVAPHAFPGSQRRRYERLKNLPSGLIVLGDALCSFNPVYGQGMTVSALEAEALDDALCVAKAEVEIGPHFARRWFASTKAVVDAAWDGVSIEDFRHPELRSERPLGLRVAQWYVGRLHRATYRDPRVTNQFYRVLSFMDSPSSLFSPRVARRVLLGRAVSPQTGTG